MRHRIDNPAVDDPADVDRPGPAGDPDSSDATARRVVEECYDRVLAYCRRHVPDGTDPYDVAQEAFLRLARSGRLGHAGSPAHAGHPARSNRPNRAAGEAGGGAGREPRDTARSEAGLESPIAYLVAVAHNLCVDAYRERRVQTVPLDAYADSPALADPRDGIGDVELACALEKLDPDLRAIVELRYDQGLTVVEAARVLGISRFAAARRLKRALADLEQLLAPHPEGAAHESAR